MKQQIIMRLLTGIAGLGIALGAATAHATPESDRQAFIKYYTSKYPNIKLEDYVYGALAFDEDSKAQYDAIMEFPPFESDIDAGRKMWETPFKNGKTYASCLPGGGQQQLVGLDRQLIRAAVDSEFDQLFLHQRTW